MHRSLMAMTSCTFLTLAGCGGGTVYYADGVDIVTRNSDFGSCSAMALIDFPVRTETRFTPRMHIPDERTCGPDGLCAVTAGYWEGGTGYWVDANASARATTQRACMSARGYARMGLPSCTSVVATWTERGRALVMPPLAEDTCLIRQSDGTEMIVNPTGI